VFVERLWRSVKYEEVYLKAYESLSEARRELGNYFQFYNSRRKHQGLDYKTPDEVYWALLDQMPEAVR
jgi:putative transposase